MTNSSAAPGYDYTLLQNLEKHPDVARAYGNYMAAFACLEQDLWLVFASILDTDYLGATRLLGHLQSFTVKIEAIENFAPHAKTLKPAGKKGVDVIFSIAREANAFRNKLAHGVFGEDLKGNLVLSPFFGSTSRKGSVLRISAKTIDDRRTLDIERLMLLIDCWNKNKPFPAGILLKPTITQKA